MVDTALHCHEPLVRGDRAWAKMSKHWEPFIVDLWSEERCGEVPSKGWLLIICNRCAQKAGIVW